MKPPVTASLQNRRATLVAVVVATLIAGLGWAFAESEGGAPTVVKPSWLVLSSTRDGSSRAYALRPNGTRLTRLLAKDRELVPLDVSADGSTIAYGQGEYLTKAVYVSRADGTGLRRVADAMEEETIEGVVLSPDGTELALATEDADENPRVFVVNADGRHRRDLGRAADPDWSPDGKKLALATGRGCAILTSPLEGGRLTRVRGRCGTPKWSPDGKTLVFATKGGCAVVKPAARSDWLEQRLDQVLGRAARVLLPGRCESPEWSPDGRWIAFGASTCPYCESEEKAAAARKMAGIWVVRPSGEDRRRLVPPPSMSDEEFGQLYAWSPDGRMLAVVDISNVFVATVDGRRRHLRLGVFPSSKPAWSSGGRLLLVGYAGRTAFFGSEDPDQIWSVRPDGRGLRRLTSAGDNDLVGFARLAPARPLAEPVAPSERVLGPTALETRKPIGRLSADGDQVAYTAGPTATDCEHVSVWTPAKISILRVWRRLPAPCDDEGFAEDSIYELALAGSFIGWSDIVSCGNTGCGTEFTTAALPKADPIPSGDDDGTDFGAGDYAYYGPVGHGAIFASDQTGIRITRAGGTVRRCNPSLDGYLSTDGRWIAARKGSSIVVLDDTCSVVRVFRLGEVKVALLDGGRLVVERSGQLEAYDVLSGALEVQRPLPAGYSLADVSRGVALLRHKRTILVLRLGDARSFSLEPGRGHVSAEIEPIGLYYSYTTWAGHGRLQLVPFGELERRIG
jgi:Tol biopolymer transport system component